MTKNQFYYTRKTPKAVKVEGKEQQFDEFRDSFNVEKVIRTITYPNKDVIVLLDDFNERVFEEPDIDPKSGKYKGMKKVRQTTHSEITLSPEDGERFFKLTNIE